MHIKTEMIKPVKVKGDYENHEGKRKKIRIGQEVKGFTKRAKDLSGFSRRTEPHHHILRSQNENENLELANPSRSSNMHIRGNPTFPCRETRHVMVTTTIPPPTG